MPLGADPPRELAFDEDLFRRLVDRAPDAMVGVDERGRIVLVNAQAEVLFGYQRDELLGRLVEELVPEAARSVHPARRASYLADPRSRPMGLGLQLAARRRDGSEFPAEISLAAFDAGGGVLISASIRDMTERINAEREREHLARQAQLERTERQVLQSQRLESLGRLAGGIAHDFNNLLAVISNYTAFVHEEIDAEFASTGADRWRAAQRDIRHVQKAAEAAAGLTRQLLTFARRDVVRSRPIDLNVVVHETVDLLERTLGEDVELGVRLESQLAPVLADPGQIQQVLVNLALNSRLAMPDGGVLVIETANVVDPDGERWVRLTVADSGVGMDSEALARAFEPFFTTRSADQGTGLGLATVYGIVTQVGGSVQLESVVDVGTTFTARFPVTAELAADVDVDGQGIQQVAAGHVLVIDDEPAIRDLVERMLVRNGFDVVVASDAAEAREFVRTPENVIDLVLSDVVMPTISGPDLMAQLRVIRPGLRVVYMSGYAGVELAAKLAVSDDIRLLEKPFGEAALVAAVVEALEAP